MGTPAGRRASEHQVLVVGLLFVAAYGTARLVLAMATPPATVSVAISLVPLAAFVLFIRACFRRIGTMDEMQRLIQLKALAFAFPAAIALIMTLGVLERAVTLPPDDFGYRHVWMVMPLFYYLGLWIAHRKYN